MNSRERYDAYARGWKYEQYVVVRWLMRLFRQPLPCAISAGSEETHYYPAIRYCGRVYCITDGVMPSRRQAINHAARVIACGCDNDTELSWHHACHRYSETAGEEYYQP